MNLSPFETASIVIVAAALAGYLNQVTLKLPQTIALTLWGAATSILVALADAVLPGLHVSRTIGGFMGAIDFKTALLNVMLSFLLFAGALHIDLTQVNKGKWLIAVLSVIGVVVSTLIVAVGFWALTAAFSIQVPSA